MYLLENICIPMKLILSTLIPKKLKHKQLNLINGTLNTRQILIYISVTVFIK